jgi:hypothetical protein
MKSVTINFDAAASLYKKKLLLRRKSDLPNGLIELPSFAWNLESRHRNGMPDKDIVRQWMRYLSMATRKLGRGGTKATMFVALIKAGTENDTFSFRLCCPYQELLDPLSDPAQIQEMADEAAGADVDVRYKFALPEALCPVVFSYEPAAKQVLVTNENQMVSPAQFLQIDKVASTSGFLNFVGTLSMLEAFDPDNDYGARLQQLMKDAITARRDEWLRWFYNFIDTRALFETAKILIDPRDPERYYFDSPAV